jgi:hypothetical protein
MIIEKLLEQRDFHLNTLKHLDFQLIDDPSKKEVEDIEKLKITTMDEIKKIEQEISFILSKK